MESYSYVDLDDDMRQPVVKVALRYKPDEGEWRSFRTLAVVDPALSICTAPHEVARHLGFDPPPGGPKRRIMTDAGEVTYWMTEVELTINGQEQKLRPNVGFGGVRRWVHLGFLKVLQDFKAEFRPFEGTFSLEYIPPKKPE